MHHHAHAAHVHRHHHEAVAEITHQTLTLLSSDARIIFPCFLFVNEETVFYA